MLGAIILILLGLTALGYVDIQLPGLDLLKNVILVINGKSITILNAVVFGVILWSLGLLPSLFRQVAGALFVLWLLSVFGVITIVWSGQFLLIAIIVLLFFAILMG